MLDLEMVCDRSIESPLECFQDTQEVLMVMRRQELTTYRCNDYMARLSTAAMGVDEMFRQRMCEWMHVVTDHFNVEREVVATGITYLDLCLSKDEEGMITSPRCFQLAALSSLYLAIKLNDQCSPHIDVESLSKLGRGLFTAKDILTMEQHVLKTLDWKLNPPCSRSFLHQYLDLFHRYLSPSTKYIISEVSKYILEMSACVYKFVECRPSVMAYAATLIAMDNINLVCLSMSHRLHMYDYMSR